MGPIGYPKTSVKNYHYSLRNNAEERTSLLLRGGNLKSRVVHLYGEAIYVTSTVSKDLLLGFLALEDGTDRLSRNTGKELPLYAA